MFRIIEFFSEFIGLVLSHVPNAVIHIRKKEIIQTFYHLINRY